MMAKQYIKTDWETIDFDKDFLPSVAVDTVIFGVHEKALKVLLLQYKHTDAFALPGGFLFKSDNLYDAAQRILTDRTGLPQMYLEQFFTFGDYGRNDPSFMELIMAARGFDPPKDHFLLRRFISVGYYALVDFTKVVPTPDILSETCQWYDLMALPPLIQDHKQIIEKALETLQQHLDKRLIVFNLLPEKFTMAELQTVYETILQTRLLRTSFQRKMLGLGILEKVEKKLTGGAHKAPYLYKFLPGNDRLA
jgi:hypothetical protein